MMTRLSLVRARSRAQRGGRGVGGQVELERRDRDIAVVDRLEVAVVAQAVLDAVEAEPVIAIAARVGALDDRTAAIIVETLPCEADALDFGGGKGGKVDIDQDRKSVVWGKSVSVRLDLGGGRLVQK